MNPISYTNVSHFECTQRPQDPISHIPPGNADAAYLCIILGIIPLYFQLLKTGTTPALMGSHKYNEEQSKHS